MRVPSPSVCTTIVVESAVNGDPVTTGPLMGSVFAAPMMICASGPAPRRPWAMLDDALETIKHGITTGHTALRRDAIITPVFAHWGTTRTKRTARANPSPPTRTSAGTVDPSPGALKPA